MAAALSANCDVPPPLAHVPPSRGDVLHPPVLRRSSSQTVLRLPRTFPSERNERLVSEGGKRGKI